MTCVERTRFGEKGAERGRGLGPCTVHVSFNEEEEGVKDFDCEERVGGASSRYADPDAEGVRPVFKTDSYG